MKQQRNSARGTGLYAIVAAMLLLFCAGFEMRDAAASAIGSADVPRQATAALAGQARAELRSLIGAGTMAGLRWPNFNRCRAAVARFYESGGYSLAWVRDGLPTPQALKMIALFKHASLQGLNPEDYDSGRWAARLDELRSPHSPPPQTDLVRFDLALTVCAMRYLSDLHAGRINPRPIAFEVQGNSGKYDLASLLRKRIVGARDIDTVVASDQPRYAGYERAEVALAKYIELAREGDGKPLPIPERAVRPGDKYRAMARLVQRLRLLGDLASEGVESTVYEGAVVGAVKRFQRRHGLEIDGVLGRNTITQLNVPLSWRVRQLALALERYRWMPSSFARAPIIVNIPEFRLHTMRGWSAPYLSMKIVVGRAHRSQTPVFAKDMQYVIFRPYWNVPLSIQRKELVPKIRRDRNYLATHGYEVVDASRHVVTDDRVTPEILRGLRSGALHIRQRPGPKNSVGLIKFVFPNRYNVYLHGTPATALFSRARRDFSHGCIRIEHPVALAAWILRNQPEWTRDRILTAIDGDRTIKVILDKPVPVLILYRTAAVAPDGEVYFFRDIYGYDAALERVLAAGYPYSGSITAKFRGGVPLPSTTYRASDRMELSGCSQ